MRLHDGVLIILNRQLGPPSPWHGYFLSLPKKTLDIAVFWHLYGGQDGFEARQWLQGTEAEKILTRPRGSQTLLVSDLCSSKRVEFVTELYDVIFHNLSL